MERPVTSRSPNIWYDFFNKPQKFNDTVKVITREKQMHLATFGGYHHQDAKLLPPVEEKIVVDAFSVDDRLIDLLEDIYSEEQNQMTTLSGAQYMAITPEVKAMLTAKLESTKGCIAKLRNAIELIDRKNPGR